MLPKPTNSILKCTLCQQDYTNPHMCPHCSQVFCKNCIKDYLSQFYFCPSCDNHIIDLVSCQRLILEAKKTVHKTQFFQDGQGGRISKCSAHNLLLKYFCKTCQRRICSDCGIINKEVIEEIHLGKKHLTQHQNHDILNESETIKIVLQKLSDNEKNVKKKLQDYLTIKNKYQLKMKLLRKQYQVSKLAIRNHYQYLINESQRQFSLLTRSYQKEQMNLNAEIQKLKKINQQANNLLSQWNIKKQLNAQSLNRVHILNDLFQDDSFEEIVPSWLSNTSLSTSIKESLKTLKMSIKPSYKLFEISFDYDQLRSSVFTYSQGVCMNGKHWYLKFYSNRNDNFDEEYLGVFLELKYSENQKNNKPNKYYYKIILKCPDDISQSVYKQSSSNFQVGECWGYNDFMPLSEIDKYLNHGKLTFQLLIRNESYSNLVTEMEFYIQKIENQNKLLEDLLYQANIEKAKLKQMIKSVSVGASKESLEQVEDSQVFQYYRQQ